MAANQDDEYEYEEEAEGRFEAGYEAFTRTAYEQARTVEEIAAEAGVVATRKRGEIIRDPILKFYVYVNAVAYRFIEEKIVVNVKRNEVTTILETIRNVSSPQFKNPEAFVLGYAVAKNGVFDERTFAAIVPKLVDLENVLIKPMDVIRYAVLWINLLEKTNPRRV